MLQESGRAIMRPLFFDFSLNDEFVVNATRKNDPLVVHQFMLGIYLSDLSLPLLWLIWVKVPGYSCLRFRSLALRRRSYTSRN
jgi:hypothetical protein